jgi:hypothetical protein
MVPADEKLAARLDALLERAQLGTPPPALGPAARAKDAQTGARARTTA